MPKDGFTTLIIGFVRLNENRLVIPYSRLFNKGHKKVSIKVVPILLNKNIKEMRIIHKVKARFFEIQYCYEVKETQRNLDKKKALAIDLGVNNLKCDIFPDKTDVTTVFIYATIFMTYEPFINSE